MANIKDLKKRIRSTKQTFKITKAMKLVSAAKLARAQEAILGARPYSNELEDTIKVVAALTDGYFHKYLDHRDGPRSLLLVFSSDKGLCGGYNSQMAKKLKNFILNEKKESDFQIRTIGKKVRDLVKNDLNLNQHYEFKKGPNYQNIRDVALELAHLFECGEFDRVYVAYNVFNSALQFTPTIKQLLPFELKNEVKTKLKEEFPFDFKYDVPPSEILDKLIPEAYINNLYTCMLDAHASEHGSRMAAMDSATKNCSDLIKRVTIKMNKLRQAAITTELIEVVSGAEALHGAM